MILALTTATPRCTVALVTPAGEPLAELAYEDELNHAERVFGTIDELFAGAGRQKGEVSFIACDVGPGSFTGVRVGLASAKGMALGLGVPLVGVGSLEAMSAAAFDVAPANVSVICSLLDAKRGETFVAAYDREGQPRLAPEHVRIGEAAALAASLGLGEIAFAGRAAAREGVAPILAGDACELPSAIWIARLAIPRLTGAPPLDLLEPVYLRAPDAKKMADRGS